jgi:hypothetical protein
MEMTFNDKKVLYQAIQIGIPCIPFININSLYASHGISNSPWGLSGIFLVRIPALFPDGIIRYLYKDELSLALLLSDIKKEISRSTGKTVIFVGLYQEGNLLPGSPFLDPRIFIGTQRTLFYIEFLEDIYCNNHIVYTRFGGQNPPIDMAYLPIERNLRVARMGIINFTAVSLLYELKERGDPAGIITSYENWVSLKYPTSGLELHELFQKMLSKVMELTTISCTVCGFVSAPVYDRCSNCGATMIIRI